MADPNVDTLRILHDEVDTRLGILRDADLRLETKSLVVLGFTLTIIPILLQSDVESA